MTQTEKVAIVRLLTDLIKADTVIDIREIELFEDICSKYNITSASASVDARKITLTEALEGLKELSDLERQSLVSRLEQLTLVDGKCEPEEALLLLALRGELQGNGVGSMASCVDIMDNIAPFTVFYVESEYDDEINDAISANFRTIENEFRLAGFEFVYVPYKAQTFKNFDQRQLMSIIRHIAPTVTQEDVQAVYDKICTLNTADFCRSLLYNKLGISCLYDTDPSMLVKISNSRVSLKPVHNYFKFVLSSNVVEDVRAFIDEYKRLVHDDKIVVRQSTHGAAQFEYRGFNKSFFDLLAFPGKSFESRVLVDVARHRIFFEDINAELELSAYERALYVFMLYANVFEKVVRRNETSQARKTRLDATFNKIYNMIGKWDNNEVKSYLTNGLSISMSRIKKQVNGLELLENKQLYIIEPSDDVLSLKVDPKKIYVIDHVTGKKTLMRESEEWKKL